MVAGLVPLGCFHRCEPAFPTGSTEPRLGLGAQHRLCAGDQAGRPARGGFTMKLGLAASGFRFLETKRLPCALGRSLQRQAEQFGRRRPSEEHPLDDAQPLLEAPPVRRVSPGEFGDAAPKRRQSLLQPRLQVERLAFGVW